MPDFDAFGQSTVGEALVESHLNARTRREKRWRIRFVSYTVELVTGFFQEFPLGPNKTFLETEQYIHRFTYNIFDRWTPEDLGDVLYLAPGPNGASRYEKVTCHSQGPPEEFHPFSEMWTFFNSSPSASDYRVGIFRYYNRTKAFAIPALPSQFYCGPPTAGSDTGEQPGVHDFFADKHVDGIDFS